MRGRFVKVGRIQYFGIQIHTQWSAGAGPVLTSALRFGVDFPNQGVGPQAQQPQVSVFEGPVQSAAAVLPASSDSNRGQFRVGAGGLEDVSGVVQSIQLAGDDNRVVNDIRMNVVTVDDELTTLFGELIAISETTTFATDQSGATVSAIVEDNTLGLATTIPGVGTVLQRIGGTGVGNIAQHVLLNGDLNLVRNLLTIDFQMKPVPAARSAAIQSALLSIQGLR